MRWFARILSIVLHPVFMPLYTLAVLIYLDPRMAWFLHDELRITTLGMIALLTVVFPLVSALLLVHAGLVSNLTMPEGRERIGPYMFTLFYHGMAWYLLDRLPLHPAIGRFLIGAAIALLIALLITVRWKISLHMVGIGGVAGTFFALGYLSIPVFFPLVVVVLVLAGALGTARLVDGAHDRGQVYAGFMLGMSALFLGQTWP